MWLHNEQAENQQGTLDGGGEGRRPNLSAAAQGYLDRLGLDVEDLFHHALATLHDPAYRAANARWRNVPAAAWNYKLGGYQVLKKWLSYRESKVLARPLTPAEAQHFTDTARRIAALLGLVGVAG